MIWLCSIVAPRRGTVPPGRFQLRGLVRDVLIVPETKPASELLVEFRARRTGMAMVVDEFGSILGLVTLEDILEQMVGEIHDEFDVVERPLVLADGSMIFDAALKVRDLETQYEISLPEDPGYETLGGFVLSRLGFIPRGGESFEAERLSLHRNGDGPAARLPRKNQAASKRSFAAWPALSLPRNRKQKTAPARSYSARKQIRRQATPRTMIRYFSLPHSVRAARAMADSHDGIPPRAYRSRRSGAADARRRGHALRTSANAAFPRPRSPIPCSMAIISPGF